MDDSHEQIFLYGKQSSNWELAAEEVADDIESDLGWDDGDVCFLEVEEEKNEDSTMDFFYKLEFKWTTEHHEWMGVLT